MILCMDDPKITNQKSARQGDQIGLIIANLVIVYFCQFFFNTSLNFGATFLKQIQKINFD
jgi:hypothetical protein